MQWALLNATAYEFTLLVLFFIVGFKKIHCKKKKSIVPLLNFTYMCIIYIFHVIFLFTFLTHPLQMDI